MRNNLQKKLLAISVIFFLASCSAFFLLYRFTNHNRESYKVTQEKWSAEETRRQNIKSMASLINRLESERTLIEEHFIYSSDVVPFFNTVENLAKQAGTGMEVSSVNVAKDNSSLAVGLKINGSFEAVYKFITFLENSPYHVAFVSADIKKLGVEDSVPVKTGKAPEWSAVLEIKLLNFINR